MQNAYNNNGYLSQASAPAPQGTIFTTDEMNALSQYTKYTLGNGLQTEKTYHDFGMMIRTTTAGIQDLVLGWNNSSGNLAVRGDNMKSRADGFQYDNLNRLVTYDVFGPLTGLTVNYANNGNITQKTDAGTYTYNPTKPHAVESVTDPDGLMPLTQNISYTPFKKPATITEGNYELTFTYGPAQQRKKSVLKNNSVVEKTITYSGNYEKIETGSDVYEVHYLGNGAINVRHNGTDNLFYAYTDHLGSILTITNAGGTVIYETNFDPWGRERNPNTWDYTANPNTKPEWLIRGFTGHEHLNEMRLINMNARLYDPIVARMLSPDNFVQDNTRTQGFNRYSYALNNPLVYTDPDGEFVLLLALGVFIVGSTLDHLLNYNNYGHESGGEAISAGVREGFNAYNQISSVTQIPVYSKNGVTISVGPSLTGLGVTGGISYSTGDWSVGVSAGAGYNTNSFAPGWEPRIGGGVSYYDDKNNVGFSAGITRFGGAHAQYNWMAGFRIDDFSITTVNDAWISGDDYRTAALELQYKGVTAGFSIYTTGVTGSETDVENDLPAWKSRRHGKHPGGLGSYLSGQRLQSAVYLGYNNGFTVSRIGFDHPKIQDYIQNGLHQNWLFRSLTGGGSPYIRTDYGTQGRVYGFDSPYYPYSLY